MLQVLEVEVAEAPGPSQSTLSLALLEPVGAEGPTAGLSRALKGAFLLSPISLKTWLSSVLFGEPLPLCRISRPSPLCESEPARLAEVLRFIWKRPCISREHSTEDSFESPELQAACSGLAAVPAEACRRRGRERMRWSLLFSVPRPRKATVSQPRLEVWQHGDASHVPKTH